MMSKALGTIIRNQTQVGPRDPTEFFLVLNQTGDV